MFYPLPAHTVFEEKQRTRRNTVFLFIILFGIYFLFSNLLIIVATALISEDRATLILPRVLPQIMLWTTVFAMAVAFTQFWAGLSKSVQDVLTDLHAGMADPSIESHQQFINIVHEAEAAIGVQGIQAAVIRTPGCNAFSIVDSQGRAAIGVTEDLLSRLDRAELSAVIAHEAAHITHEDSRLVALSCSLCAVFAGLNAMFVTQSDSENRTVRFRARGKNGAGILVLFLIVAVGKILTRLLSMAISRNREFLADSEAVHLCRDPLSLAEALYKISRSARGAGFLPQNYSALFIMNPVYSKLEQMEDGFSDLFSTHPPEEKRIQLLLEWAKVDHEAFKQKVIAEIKEHGEVNDKKYYAFKDGQWKGPESIGALVAIGLKPMSWVGDGERMLRSKDFSEMTPYFRDGGSGKSAALGNCPRCDTSLKDVLYENVSVKHCEHCQGYLLSERTLSAIIVSRGEKFSAEKARDTLEWRKLQAGTLKDLCQQSYISCPLCEKLMNKTVHTVLTKVVIDRCLNESCRAIWCDGGELEKIQVLLEEAQK